MIVFDERIADAFGQTAFELSDCHCGIYDRAAVAANHRAIRRDLSRFRVNGNVNKICYIRGRTIHLTQTFDCRHCAPRIDLQLFRERAERDAAFGKIRTVDDALHQFRVGFNHQRIGLQTENARRVIKNLLLDIARCLQCRAAARVHAARCVRDHIVHGRQCVGGRDANFFYRHAQFFRDDFGNRFKCAAAVVHHRVNYIHRTVLVDFDERARIINHFAGFGCARAARVKTARHADAVAIASRLRSRIRARVPTDFLRAVMEQLRHAVTADDGLHRRTLSPKRAAEPDIIF